MFIDSKNLTFKVQREYIHYLGRPLRDDKSSRPDLLTQNRNFPFPIFMASLFLYSGGKFMVNPFLSVSILHCHWERDTLTFPKILHNINLTSKWAENQQVSLC